MRTTNDTGSTGLYLDCAALLPGDILLTADDALVSAAIRAGTGGPFSHAALIMSMTFRLEAAGDGTGYTPMFFDRVEQLYEPRRGRFLHRLPAATRGALVLRKPGFADVAPDLTPLLMTLSRPFLWKEYPELARTAAVFKARTAGRLVFEPFLRLLDRVLHNTPTNPGEFCSSLVATIYETLGHRLLTDRTAAEISPNHFLEAGLDTVAGAITDPVIDAELNDDVRTMQNALLRLAFSRDVLPGLVEFMTTVERLKQEALPQQPGQP